MSSERHGNAVRVTVREDHGQPGHIAVLHRLHDGDRVLDVAIPGRGGSHGLAIGARPPDYVQFERMVHDPFVDHPRAHRVADQRDLVLGHRAAWVYDVLAA